MALFVFAGGDAWAAIDTLYREEVINASFPYLSPIAEQRNVLINAFGFQMALFGGINGTAGVSVLALRYLAATAVLVGALMIIFNARNRKAAIVVPWVLLVIITVLAPYGSKLLFHPVTTSEVRRGLTDNLVTVGECPNNPQLCGFTPQLAAIHVAALLQLTFSDLFNSLQWKGLIDEAIARDSLESSAKLVASPDWPHKVDRFRGMCPNTDWADIMNARSATLSRTAIIPNDRYVLQTMRDQWEAITRPMRTLAPGSHIVYPPKAIRLWTEDEYNAEANKVIGRDLNNDNMRAAYESGIQELYSAVTGDRKVVRFGGGSLTNGNISIETALETMQLTGFFDTLRRCDRASSSVVNVFTDSCGVMPGFFFVYSGANEEDNAWARGAYNAGTAGLRGVGATTTGAALFSGGAVALASLVGIDSIQPYVGDLSPSKQAEYVQYYFGVDNGASRIVRDGTTGADIVDTDGGIRQEGVDAAAGTPWRAIVNEQILDHPVFRTMPVGVVSYGMADPRNSVLQANGEPAPVVADEPMMSCLREGNRLIDEAIEWTMGVEGKAKQLEPLNQMLVGRAEFQPIDPDRPLALNGRQIINQEVTRSDGTNITGDTVRFYQNDKVLAESLMKAFADAEATMARSIGQELTPVQRRNLYTQVLIDSVQGATSLLRANTQEEGVAARDSQNLSVVGNETLTSIGGWGAAFFGEILTKIGAWLTGPLAAGIVYFLSILVDMSLLMLIVLTPIMFLIALAMPHAAMGVMTIAVLGAFILKAVPITLLILNNIGGLIYAMIGTGGGDKASVMQSMMIIAMGGLYANLVGLTFFLLFKLGDPSAVLGRLTALDGSAKQIAEKGLAATVTAATIAAVGALGMAGAAGGKFALWNRARKLATDLGVPKEALDVMQQVTAPETNQQETPEQKAARLAKEKAEADKKAADQQAQAGTAAETEGALPGTPADDETGSAREATSALDSLGLTDDERAAAAANPPLLDEMIKNAENYKDSLSPTEAAKLALHGSATDKNGNKVKIQDGQLVPFGEGTGADVSAMTQVSETRQDGVLNGVSPTVIDPAEQPDAQQAIPAGSPSAPQVAQKGAPPAVDGQGGAAPIAAGSEQEQLPSTGDDGAAKPITNTVTAPETQANAAEKPAGAQPQIADKEGGAGVPPAGGEVRAFITNTSDIGQATANAQSATQNTSVEERAEKIVEDRKAKEIADKREELETAGRYIPEARAELEELGKKAGKMSEQDFARERQAILQKHGASDDLVNAKINMNQQIGDAKSAIKNSDHYKKLVAGDAADTLSAKEKEELANIREYLTKLDGTDTAALTVGNMALVRGAGQKMMQALEARGAADQVPSMGRTMLSGLYGAWAGAGGGISKLPIIGPAISEATNEFYQAPERARAWKASGGFMSWYSKQGDAQRAGFYSKEMAPLAAAAQYDSMMTRGGFQAQHDIAVSAARQAIEQSRAQFEAMAANRKEMMSPVLQTMVKSDSSFMASLDGKSDSERAAAIDLEVGKRFNEMLQNPARAMKDVTETLRTAAKNANPQMSDEGVDKRVQDGLIMMGIERGFSTAFSKNELVGFGRMDGVDKVQSVRSEAMMMQGDSLKVQVSKGGLVDGNLLSSTGEGINARLNVETEEKNVYLTADMLTKFRGDLALKRNANNFDAMMIDHYGLAEKQFLRGDAEWNSTQNMSRSVKAAAAFARKDVSTDYLVGGHIKMVSGKERFLEAQGQYKTLVEFRNQTNEMISDYMRNALASANNSMSNALAKAGVDVGKLDNLDVGNRMVEMRSQLEKAMAKQMRANKEYAPLNLVFDSASAKGIGTYTKKARLARSEMEAQEEEIIVAVEKSRASHFEAVVKGVQTKHTKEMSIDHNGEMLKLKSATRVTMDLANQVAKENAEKVTSFMAEVSKDLEKKGIKVLDSFKVTNGKGVGKESHAQAFIPIEAWNEMYKRADAEMKGYLDGIQAKARTETDKIVLAEFKRTATEKIDFNSEN